jgi:hypothetical protein
MMEQTAAEATEATATTFSSSHRIHFWTARSITTYFRCTAQSILAVEGIEAEATKLEKQRLQWCNTY